MSFCLYCCVWLLLLDIGNVIGNHTTTLFVSYGQDVKINCSYNKTYDTHIMAAILKSSNNTLCSYRFTNKTWTKQKCNKNVRFVSVLDREEIFFFELLNLQIQSSTFFTCTVKRVTKPPELDLGVKRLQIIASPLLIVSCVKRPEGSPMILCSVKYYQDSYEQLWIRDGETLNISHANKSTDGSFIYKSYFILPSTPLNKIYSCWVNFSSFNEPVVASLSSSECYEKHENLTLILVSIMFAVLPISLIIIIVLCRNYKRAHQSSHVQANVTQSEVYSMLGAHNPVPCSPVGHHATTGFTQLHYREELTL